VKVLHATDTANTFPTGELGLRTWSNSLVRVDAIRVTSGNGSAMTVKSSF